MKAYDLINILSAIPTEFEVNLNGEFEINEITINFDAQELLIIVPEVQDFDENDYKDYGDCEGEQ